LVILLSLYDRFPELRRRLMQPVRHHAEQTNQGLELAPYGQDATLTALALNDPGKTIAWYLASLQQLDKDTTHTAPRSWKPIADALGNHGEQLGQVITESVLGRWTIDREDL
jgi:hypothetical protein